MRMKMKVLMIMKMRCHNKNIKTFKWVWWRNKSKQKKKIIKEINDHIDDIIDKSKSFEEQNKSLKKFKNLNNYYNIDENDFDDKKLKFTVFKLKLGHLSNEIAENLFEQIFIISLKQ